MSFFTARGFHLNSTFHRQKAVTPVTLRKVRTGISIEVGQFADVNVKRC